MGNNGVLGKFKNLGEKAKFYFDKVKKENSKLNIFLSLNENVLKEAKELDKKIAKGKLYGYVFGIKSNINVLGMEANCASETLKGFISPYDASVIERIKAEDGLILGMLNMDEFASGSSGESSAFGACENPSALGKIPGGSSSGSAAAIAAGFCDVTLGSDTGGSIRNPASHCGVVGYKPSYGLISRYGLIDLSMSLDQIGPLGRNVDDVARVLEIISGVDERDTKTEDFGKIKLEKVGKLKIGVLRVKGIDKEIENLIDERVKEVAKKKGYELKDVEIRHIELAVQTYYPLVYVEFFSGTRRFDGRKYGKKIEESCGKEVLRRILGGSEITRAEYKGEYYRKALDIKELIKEEFENAFGKFDCIVSPTVPSLPWDIGEGDKMKVEEIYAADALTIPANLAEICAISLPAGKVDGIPVGLQIMCAKGQDSKLLSIAREFELS